MGVYLEIVMGEGEMSTFWIIFDGMVIHLKSTFTYYKADLQAIYWYYYRR